ncbi:flagellar hook assembly protein FlgD [Parvibium lacunae]|uniref:Basal-body rod modification protein FlgD n=1 Tax=Parvibium lacunae TaxID=1888893 RepID=A0A368L3Q4_9BURK|nr:flagellar hook assembly protein FlgD [Parvibium lacunae]RCS58199.1 flagellar hook assembly protein FlgD [Parvibium lacunae]
MLSIASNTTNPYAGLPGASRPNTEKTTSEALQDRFLSLLTTQMKNQDPLNPLENSELTSQLAQINTVTGINQVNSAIESLASGLNGLQTLQSALLMGKGVLVPGNTAQLTNGQTTTGYELKQPVDNLKMTVKDARGNVVFEKDLGAQQSGVNAYTWDGYDNNGQKLTDGKYSVTWSASQGGNNIEVTGLTYGQVMGVNQSGNSTSLTVSGQASPYTLSQIRRIL